MINLEEPPWWVQLPVLTGQNLELREVDADDVETLFELLTDPKVSRYISPPPSSARAFAGFIEWAHQQRVAGTCVCFAVVPKGLHQAIGLFQLRALEPTFKIAEWGFAMGASFWSTGLFEEAAALVLDFAFRHVGVHRVEARAVVENGRGNRALEKLGAKGEAELRRAFKEKESQFLWAIVSEEWSKPKPVERTPFDQAKIRRQIETAISQFTAPSAKSPEKRKDAPKFGSRPFPFFLTDSSRDPSEN